MSFLKRGCSPVEGQDTSHATRDSDKHRELVAPFHGHYWGLKQISESPVQSQVTCPVLNLAPNLCHEIVSPNVLEEMSTLSPHYLKLCHLFPHKGTMLHRCDPSQATA